jgi:DNA-binding GntR family transcriptional regulator
MRGALLTLPGELALSQEFHRELIEAIAQRDVARAVKLREGALEVDEQKLLLQLRDSLRKSGRSTS